MSPVLDSIGSVKAYGWGSLVSIDPGFYSISTVTLSSSATSITFTNIPQTYDHLQVRAVQRSSYAGIASVGCPQMRFNGDTGNNYSNHRTGTFATGAFADYEINQNMAGGISFAPAANADSNTFGAFIMDILNYKNTNMVKTVKTVTSAPITATGGWATQTANTWYSTAAINEINFIGIQDGVSALVAGTQFALYGIKN